MSLLKRTLPLSSGASIPQLGYGTWNLQGKEIEPALWSALEIGYRHFDFAMIYENQKEIGTILSKWMNEHPKIPRSDFFFTSKLWNTDHRHVRMALLQTLNDLQIEYLDLYLIHWPFPQLPHGLVDKNRSLLDTWEDLLLLKNEGLVKHLGVSNFTQDHLESILDESTLVPEINQFEIHPLLPQHSLIQYCQSHQIQVTAYCPLGSTQSPLFSDPILTTLATKHQATIAQILINWGIDRGYAVIPKSAHPDRIRSNTHVVPLTPEDHQLIDGLLQTYGPKRMCDPRDFYGIDLFHEGERPVSK